MSQSNDSTHHYLDINIINNSMYDTNVPLVFNQTRTNNLIENASEYDLSIIRFSINSPILPIMSAIIDINQPDVDILKIGFKCIWSIFLNNSINADISKWVEMPLYFETQDYTLTQPSFPYNKNHFSDLYFNIHNFQQFASMLNIAIYKASLLLQTPISGVLPKFEIEPMSHRVIFSYNPSTFVTKGTCQIAFNGPLYSMLNGFNCSKMSIYNPSFISETNDVYEKKSIKLPQQYDDYYHSNISESNNVYYIESGAPAINVFRNGKQMNEGSASRTHMLLDMNNNGFEVSTINNGLLTYDNLDISSSIVKILENQYHRLYYNCVLIKNSQYIFSSRSVGFSSNHLIKTYNTSPPFEPLTTNNDVAGFNNIVQYLSDSLNEADSTYITCAEGDYLGGYIFNDTGGYNIPAFWYLKGPIEINNNKQVRRANLLYTASPNSQGIVVGMKNTSDEYNSQYFFGSLKINAVDKGEWWRYIKNYMGGNSVTRYYLPDYLTPIASVIFDISDNEHFLLAGAVENSPFYNKQIVYPIIYDNVATVGRYIIINVHNMDILKYSIESSFKIPGNNNNTVVTKNAKFVGNVLYLTSDITFNTDVYEYNSTTDMFELISSFPAFSLKDSTQHEPSLTLYGVTNKTKTPINTMSVANPLVLFSNLQKIRPSLASNIYPIMSPYPIPTGTDSKLIQFNVSIQVGNNINTINFSSNLLPIAKSSVANPVIFNDQVPGEPFVEATPQSGSNNSISNIVTDFSQYLATATEDRDHLLYNPSGEYRLINLVNNQPIRDIDLSVTYTDNYGQTFPLLLRPQCSATIKLMFRRKNYFNRN